MNRTVVWSSNTDKPRIIIFGEGKIVGANKESTTFEVRFADGQTRHLRATFLRPADLPE